MNGPDAFSPGSSQQGQDPRALTDAALAQALLAAQRAGPVLEPLRILSDAELEAPIDFACDAADAAEPAPDAGRALPSIPGYRLEEVIGSGGQATVYRAVQLVTGRTVAIKVLTGGAFVSARHKRRFDREAAILAALEHPEVVGILDRGRTPEGLMYLAMEYIEGVSLDQFVTDLRNSGGVHGLQSILHVFINLCRTIDAAHRGGVVHRDLKPGNVRVSPLGRPYVLDFGMARVMWAAGGASESVTVSGQVLGSLPWSSPEQLTHDPDALDARCDVYALGMMLYQALSGRLPYRGLGPVAQVMEAIRTARPAPLRDGSSALPISPELEAVVLKALAKAPQQRYPTAEALAADLERIVDGQPTLARPSRRRVIIAACALVLLASAAVAGWRAYRHSQWLAPALDMPRQVNAAGIELVRLNGGPLLIGSPISEAGRDGSERQARLEVPGPFWISTTEVTQRQYQAVMGRLPAGIAQAAPDLPVTNITWHEAMAFCAALGEREGRRYRLPTEAEWELACRAGSASAYAQPLERTGWWQSNSGRRLHAVGTLAPNRWGIQDMHGNAAEWCWSDRAAYYGSAPPDPAWKAVRGGSAVESDVACRSASRQFLRPGQRSAWVGFRIVYDPASTGAISDPPGFFVSAATQPH